MLTKTVELLAAAAAGLGGIYFYKRGKGAPAPPVAPVLPKMPPAPQLPPTVAQLQAAPGGYIQQGSTGYGVASGSAPGVQNVTVTSDGGLDSSALDAYL